MFDRAHNMIEVTLQRVESGIMYTHTIGEFPHPHKELGGRAKGNNIIVL